MKAAARAFTLLELMFVLLIMALLMSFGWYGVREVEKTRTSRARADAEMLAAAVWGETKEHNGFVGDMGRLPTMSGTEGLLPELTYGGGSLAARGAYRGETYGWWGPYAGFDRDALMKDPWSQPWTFTAAGQLKSLGANGVPSGSLPGAPSDDILIPAFAPASPTGLLSVTVVDGQGMRLDHNKVLVRVYSSIDGVLTPDDETTSTNGVFSFTNLPQGRHVVEAHGSGGDPNWPTTARGYGTAWVGAAGRSALQIRMRGFVAP